MTNVGFNITDCLTDRGLRAEYARLVELIDARGGYTPDTEDLGPHILLSDVRDALLEQGIDIEAENRVLARARLDAVRDAQRAGARA